MTKKVVSQLTNDEIKDLIENNPIVDMLDFNTKDRFRIAKVINETFDVELFVAILNEHLENSGYLIEYYDTYLLVVDTTVAEVGSNRIHRITWPIEYPTNLSSLEYFCDCCQLECDEELFEEIKRDYYENFLREQL